MSRALSPSFERPFGVARVCEEWRIARSSFYLHRTRSSTPPPPPGKRGPKTEHTDTQLTERIREVLSASPFSGEGYRKVWARLRLRGVRAGKARILRLMREAGLLAAQRGGGPRGPRNHDGTIRTEAPDEMWGTDATATTTVQNGQVAVFVAVDHCTSEVVGLHASRRADRFQALEPILQGIRTRFGGVREAVASGLSIRHDHGSQYMSRDFQRQIAFLGAESSPSFVRAPEGNGIAERFIRTLKEQVLWTQDFDTVEELRLALLDWADLYNREWLVQRHGHLSPAQVRERLTDHPRAA